MAGNKRPRPQGVPAKLLAIREAFGASQSQIAYALKIKATARICEYESGIREPNILVLLSYARLVHIPLEYLVDDEFTLTQFRYVLAMKERFVDQRIRFVTRRLS